MALYLGEEVIGKVIVGTQSSGGTDTSDATLTSGAQMLSPYTAYSKGTKYTGTIATRSASSATASGATVSFPAGYYPNAVSKSVATTTVASPSVSVNSTTGLVTATQNQDAGYVSADTTTGTLQLSTQAAKTVTPGSSQQTAVAAGKYTTGAVTVAAVSASSPTFTSNGTYTPETGEYYESVTVNVSGGGTINNQNKTVTPTESQQTVQADAGYTGLGTVTVNAISSTYVGSDVPRQDSTDLTVSGATVTAPAGYYAESASKSVASGTAGTPTATKGTVSNNSVTVTPSVTNTTGYITGDTKTGTAVTVSASELVSGTKAITGSGTTDVTNYASASVEEGSATTPATTITANPSISVSSSGLITATASASRSITPTVGEGYVSSGTAGTVTVSGSNTQQLTTKSAATYNTSTTDQTIASGQYLTGTQTIKAVRVSGLSADSILSGVTVTVGDANDADRIASVTGTVAFQTYYTGSSAPSSSLGVDGDIYLQTS